MGRLVNSRILSATFVLTALLLFGGCETTTKKDMGTAFGALVGGLLGSQIDDNDTRGAIIGALVGGVVGRMIGDYMDESDKAKLAETLNQTPPGKTVNWHNDRSGNDFEVTPTSDYYAQEDKQCRTFDQVVYVDGRREVMEGIACKSPGSEALAIDGIAI